MHPNRAPVARSQEIMVVGVIRVGLAAALSMADGFEVEVPSVAFARAVVIVPIEGLAAVTILVKVEVGTALLGERCTVVRTMDMVSLAG